MNVFWKVAAGILTAVILWLNVNRTNKDMAILMSLSVCAMALTACVAFLEPVITFVRKLQDVGRLDNDLVSIVLKSVGVGIVTEIAVLTCKVAGNESMGKTLQFVSAVAILWMAIPVFEQLLILLDGILGAL